MKLLREHTHFRQLLEQAALYEHLLNTVHNSLPSSLRPHVIGAAPKGASLVLQVDQAHFATQIRLCERQVLEAVLDQWPHLPLKQVKVQLMHMPVHASPRLHAPKRPEHATIEQMEKLSQQIKNEKIRESLKRLAKTLAKVT